MNRAQWESRQADRERNVERRRAELNRPQATVTWLDPPVLLHPAKRVKVVGVASDASPETRREYGVS